MSNIKNMLWETTPQHKVYNWMKNANEKGYNYLVVAYNKENYNFVPVMCNDLEEAEIWISYFSQNEKYLQDVLIQNTEDITAIKNAFVTPNLSRTIRILTMAKYLAAGYFPSFEN
jgi:hypothetical protein